MRGWFEIGSTLRPCSLRQAHYGLGLNWVCFGFELGLIGFELALIGFELALFLGKIPVFGAKSGEIGFVLHKKVFLCALVS